MRLLIPLIGLGAVVGLVAVARAEGKRKAVRGATLDPILSDEEADEVLSDAGDDVVTNQIDQCVNQLGQSFTFDELTQFAASSNYDVFWSDVALTNQTPKFAYTTNPYSRAFDATRCSFMVWAQGNTWIIDQVTNAELAGWKANQDLNALNPPPFFPQF